MRAAVRGALFLASIALLSSPSRHAPRSGLGVSPFGGIDMSALDLEMSAGCEVGTDGCEVVEPLVTVELRADLLDETSEDPRAPSVVNDADVAAVSDAFFVWLTHPPESFWVNLAPTESDRVIDAGLGDTDAGKILLEADLLLKRTAARLLHPDHELGGAFWDQLYGWVGTRDSKLCHSFRQWIVPGVAQLQVTEQTTSDPLPLLHVLRAPLRVRQEAEYAAGGGGFAQIAIDAEGAVREMCSGADPAAQTEASRLFESIVLPELERSVNEWPEYARLRRVYLWRVVSEYYRSGGVDLDDADDADDANDGEAEEGEEEGETCDARAEGTADDEELNRDASRQKRRERNKKRVERFVDRARSFSSWKTRWRRLASDAWTPESVWDRYVASATTGEFALTRDVSNARGDVFRRTYFHGGIDWRTVRFCVEASDDSSGSWCEGIAEAKAGSRGGARSTYRLASFEREGALSLVASSSARARD
jgi:hypothetical protein